MLDLYITENRFQRRKDLNIQKGTSIAVNNQIVLDQLRLLRGDCNWFLEDLDMSKKKIQDGDLDGLVLQKSGDSTGLEKLKRIELPLDPIIPEVIDNVVRFQHEGIADEQQKMITDLESNIKSELLSIFPDAQIALLIEIDEFEEGYKKNSLKLVFKNEKFAFPFLLKLSSQNPNVFAERFIDKVKGFNPKKVFISRDLKSNDSLMHALQSNGYTIKGKSLIEYKAIEIENLPQCEWIFFSNKRSVQFFFVQNPHVENQKIACISKPVADELRKYNRRADFIGATDARMVAKQFDNISGSAKVLFPRGKSDVRSIQKGLKRINNVDLIVYETLTFANYRIPESDVLVFTSPQNVLTFLEQNSFGDKRIVAYGDATYKTLKMNGATSIYPVNEFNNIGLARSIYAASL